MERKLVLRDGTKIGTSEKCFIIAEVGQNHQGEINIAKKLIEVAKQCGANCVKFQKTCLKEKFNSAALKRPYNNPNSWGETYGEHKKHLEFTEEQFRELQAFANQVGILFTASAMDTESLKFLIRLNVPFVKIGSGDANNLLLIEEAARAQIPLIISTGMSTMENVVKIHECVKAFHKNFALLHCVSAYPTPVEDVNLNVMKLFRNRFLETVVGYSGHELGVDISVAAVALGAKILERHITLNKNWRGSDHACSLQSDEFKDLVTKIRSVETALGEPVKKICSSEEACILKLGKTIVLKRSVKAGHILECNDLAIKVAEPRGIDGARVKEVIGRKVRVDLKEDQPLLDEYLG